jgi:hypothetical protein
LILILFDILRMQSSKQNLAKFKEGAGSHDSQV